MNEILSFYEKYPDGREVRESLEGHIREALSYSENLQDSRLMRLATRLRGGDKLPELLNLSIILHDSGKAFLQRNNRTDEKKGRQYISFSGHEFISAVIAKLFTDHVLRATEFPEIRAVVFAVYYHHHAMNPIVRRQRPYLQIAIREKVWAVERLKGVLGKFLKNEMRDYLNSALDDLEGKMGLDYLVSVERIFDEIYLKSRNPDLFKISLLTLDGLIVCDYLAAGSRGGEASAGFSKSIELFRELWMGGPTRSALDGFPRPINSC